MQGLPQSCKRQTLFRVCPLKDYRIRIYDRKGLLVFTSNDISVAWDGTHHGVQQDANVFYYYIDYLTGLPNSSTRMIKGDITLIR